MRKLAIALAALALIGCSQDTADTSAATQEIKKEATTGGPPVNPNRPRPMGASGGAQVDKFGHAVGK